jgi:hypothetical protein
VARTLARVIEILKRFQEDRRVAFHVVGEAGLEPAKP